MRVLARGACLALERAKLILVRTGQAFVALGLALRQLVHAFVTRGAVVGIIGGIFTSVTQGTDRGTVRRTVLSCRAKRARVLAWFTSISALLACRARSCARQVRILPRGTGGAL